MESRAITGTVLGDVITLGTGVAFNGTNDNSAYLSISALDSQYFAIGYQDTGNSNYASGIIGFEASEGAAIPELPTNTIWKVIIALLALGLVVGVATFMKKKGTLDKSSKK